MIVATLPAVRRFNLRDLVCGGISVTHPNAPCPITLIFSYLSILNIGTSSMQMFTFVIRKTDQPDNALPAPSPGILNIFRCHNAGSSSASDWSQSDKIKLAASSRALRLHLHHEAEVYQMCRSAVSGPGNTGSCNLVG